MFRNLGCIVTLLLMVALSGCAVNPVTGKNELSWISEADQINIGEQQYLPSQQSQGGIYLVDSDVNKYVNEVGQRIAQYSPVDLPYEFVVLNNSVPNAWALPGGKIAINRGLLLALNNEAELAAVLSHEIVHAAAKHGAQSMQRQSITQGLLTATAIAVSSSEYRQYADYVVGGAKLGAQLIGTRYGRDAELEADYYGIQYMLEAGYAPSAAITLQQTFMRLSKSQETNWLQGLFASHPPSQERVNRNQQTVNALNNADGNLFVQRYEQNIAHLRSVKSAYDKSSDAQELIKAGKLDAAMGKVVDALQIEPKESKFYGQKGDILYQMGKYQDAIRAYNSAISYNEYFFEYYLGRGLTRLKQNKNVQARQDLEQSNALLATSVANQNLGELALSAGNRTAAKNYFQVAMTAPGEIGSTAKLAYAKLDLRDNPKRYIVVEFTQTSKGELVVIVQNRSLVVIKNLQLIVNAVINDNALEQQITVANLPAREQRQLLTAWRIGEGSTVTGLQARPLRFDLD